MAARKIRQEDPMREAWSVIAKLRLISDVLEQLGAHCTEPDKVYKLAVDVSLIADRAKDLFASPDMWDTRRDK